MGKGKAIGIDIGGTNYRIGLVAEDASVSGFEKASSRIICDGGEAPELLAAQIQAFIDRNAAGEQIECIGIGFPSPVDAEQGIVHNCPNLQNETGGFDGRNVKKVLEERLRIPTHIKKDANILLQYELEIHGWIGKGITIGIYYGTGIGNSVYLNDRFLEGRHGVATDLGHITFFQSNRYCTCGNRGCAEAHAAGHVLRTIWEEQFADEPFEELFHLHADTPPLMEFVEAMAVPFATEVNLFDPDRVVVGGGVFGMKGFPFERLLDFVYEFTRKPYPGRDYEVVMASDKPYAGVAGAGLYAFGRQKALS